MLNLKTSSLTLALSFLAAGVVQAHEHCHHSIDVGVGLGGQYGNFNYKVTEADLAPPVHRSFDLNKHAFAGGPSLGYRLKWKKVMLGLEGDYLFTDFKRTRIVQDIGVETRSGRIKSEGAWGAVAKVGYFVRHDFVPYVGAGIEGRKFKVSYVISDQPNDSIQRSTTQTAFAARLGFDFHAAPHFLVGAEYRKAFYADKTFRNGTTTLKFKPEVVDTILLTAKYSFHLPKKM